jgi:hypothetical protein
MKQEKPFALTGSIRTVLNFSILALFAGGATFGATAVAAHGKGHDKGAKVFYWPSKAFHGGNGGHGQADQGRTCAQTTQVAFKACGIVPAVFTVGDVYRQEWLLGDAEDVAENLSITESESTPAASCSGDCAKTHEYSPLEPDVSESKFYATGVGVIVTLDDNDPAFREELVEFTPAL